MSQEYDTIKKKKNNKVWKNIPLLGFVAKRVVNFFLKSQITKYAEFVEKK